MIGWLAWWLPSWSLVAAAGVSGLALGLLGRYYGPVLYYYMNMN